MSARLVPPPTSAPLSRSERRLLELVFHRGALRQSALADELELTQQSVSRLIAGLIDRGMLRFGDRVSLGKRGSPAVAIRLAPDHVSSIGVAVHADSVALAVVDFSGAVLFERHAVPAAMSRDAVFQWLDGVMDDPALAALWADKGPAGVGVGIAGSFLGEAIGFNTSRTLDDWANLDVAALFSERLRLPAWVDNDGNAAALAESIGGVGRWASSFAYLYLSTGVGGGVVLDGHPWRGRFGNAGEFAGGLPPDIYPFPNLELLRNIAARDGLAFKTVREMVAAYDPSWPAIDDWIARVRDSVSIIASNATAILDLEAIVIGGFTPPDLAARLGARIELFDQRRRAQSRPVARLVASEIPGDAAAIGAAMLPLRAMFSRQGA